MNKNIITTFLFFIVSANANTDDSMDTMESKSNTCTENRDPSVGYFHDTDEKNPSSTPTQLDISLPNVSPRLTEQALKAHNTYNTTHSCPAPTESSIKSSACSLAEYPELDESPSASVNSQSFDGKTNIANPNDNDSLILETL